MRLLTVEEKQSILVSLYWLRMDGDFDYRLSEIFDVLANAGYTIPKIDQLQQVIVSSNSNALFWDSETWYFSIADALFMSLAGNPMTDYEISDITGILAGQLQV